LGLGNANERKATGIKMHRVFRPSECDCDHMCCAPLQTNPPKYKLRNPKHKIQNRIYEILIPLPSDSSLSGPVIFS